MDLRRGYPSSLRTGAVACQRPEEIDIHLLAETAESACAIMTGENPRRLGAVRLEACRGSAEVCWPRAGDCLRPRSPGVEGAKAVALTTMMAAAAKRATERTMFNSVDCRRRFQEGRA
eukprot:3934942-Rhodomonas_salina.3